jgi:hypothetical protein
VDRFQLEFPVWAADSRTVRFRSPSTQRTCRQSAGASPLHVIIFCHPDRSGRFFPPLANASGSRTVEGSWLGLRICTVAGNILPFALSASVIPNGERDLLFTFSFAPTPTTSPPRLQAVQALSNSHPRTPRARHAKGGLAASTREGVRSPPAPDPSGSPIGASLARHLQSCPWSL